MTSSTNAPIDAIAASVQRERTNAGLSLTELSARAGVAKSTLSQLEAGKGNPSVETLWAISTALGLPLSRIVDPPRAHVHIIRAGQGPTITASEADYEATLLSACPPNSRRDIFLITAQPGDARRSASHTLGIVEHVIISHGRAKVGPADSPMVLNPGDYMTYPGDEPHYFEALEPNTRAILISEIN
ncbi:helix-turn-helix domain-containing protein [Natronoglycomyces albus]|uniref:Helix-turn-helix transcriptional regulator n=1 Tax=Natronoglycomyces albus TaxID=2811108 RepID=A0A895XM64_9ACTN|nr:XRE family transcriptional regulator [Natronoglycomyces albus]QSB04499.1 helix-turn-helix transcriptional regulator [Natronoglycomyces albus]